MHVVLRVDGGSQIGYGHLIRSRALIEELHSREHTITVATTTPGPAKEVLPEGTTTVDLPSRGDPEPFISCLNTESPDAVFTDAYPVDTAYQWAIRDRVPLAVLQDDARHAICADLFTNGNLYAPNLNYEFAGEPPEQYLGTDYVLLRREVRKRAADEPQRRKQPKRAIIILGGSDIGGLTPTVVRAFDGCDLHIDAIVGPGFSIEHEQAIRNTAAECTADVRVDRDPADLVDRMAEADFAVSTASSTTYELLALGTPIISIPVADNQEPIAAALRTCGIATVLQRGDGQAAFHSAITEYIHDAEIRKRRQERGRDLVDGRGAERITEAMIKLAQY